GLLIEINCAHSRASWSCWCGVELETAPVVPFRKLRTVLHCRIEHSMRVGLCVCLFILLWYANSPTRSGMVQFIGRNCRGQGIRGTGCLTRWITGCSAVYTNDHVSGLHNDCS